MVEGFNINYVFKAKINKNIRTWGKDQSLPKNSPNTMFNFL